jgi:multidrug efflux pump subunit AcrA (membrane-fusion protein)
VKGDVLTKYGLVCNKKSDEKYSFSFFDASAFSYTTSSSVSTVDGIAGDSYSGDYTTSDRLTAAEIAELKTQMKDLDLEIRVAKNELAQMQKEADNGQVLATVAGTVSSVQDADEARSGGTPMIKVTGTGGYTIECTVDELSRDDLSIGEEVEVTSYDSGMQYTGTISTIGDMPVTSQYYYYGTSSNTSYYTFTVTVSSDADFSDNEYVSVTTNGSGDSSESGFYLESMFILTEGSKSYVYVRGENNKLEKRQVKTGTISYGSVEILSGLDRDTDWVAFPYGTSIKDGAATREATLDELYSY